MLLSPPQTPHGIEKNVCKNFTGKEIE